MTTYHGLCRVYNVCIISKWFANIDMDVLFFAFNMMPFLFISLMSDALIIKLS